MPALGGIRLAVVRRRLRTTISRSWRDPVSALPTSDGPAVAPERLRDAERTRAGILAGGTAESADRGYAGARINEIADKTSTPKRMIYYYFGGKEGLYIAVLEQAYSRIRTLEQPLDVDPLGPAG